jgi:hypothetical protein
LRIIVVATIDHPPPAIPTGKPAVIPVPASPDVKIAVMVAVDITMPLA